MISCDTYQRTSDYIIMSRDTTMPLSGQLTKEEYENTKRKYT
ncbi:MAG: hypothetical protein ACKO96_20315 [Flammeovirgaceae bacterium]